MLFLKYMIDLGRWAVGVMNDELKYALWKLMW